MKTDEIASGQWSYKRLEIQVRGGRQSWVCFVGSDGVRCCTLRAMERRRVSLEN